ncbi:MAG: orotidine-5'-phosphate decarboxylase [Bdellovibrionales bacterium]|nr:orotidine-5'-phosphate decarboxylase [Bdellovibrionales bacterium]
MGTGLYVALDFPGREEARAAVAQLKDTGAGFKVGLELFCSAGPDFVRELVDGGADVFLDLKFHDIPHTVEAAVRAVSRLGARFINLHLAGGEEMSLRALACLRDSGSPSKLLGVTVLTSMDDAALKSIGVTRTVEQHVTALARQAQTWGLHGVVCSPLEVRALRAACGPDFVTMVPGIRPVDGFRDDQKRTLAPMKAKEAGASHIVVGRPITQASDPRAVTMAILEELSR